MFYFFRWSQIARRLLGVGSEFARSSLPEVGRNSVRSCRANVLFGSTVALFSAEVWPSPGLLPDPPGSATHKLIFAAGASLLRSFGVRLYDPVSPVCDVLWVEFFFSDLAPELPNKICVWQGPAGRDAFPDSAKPLLDTGGCQTKFVFGNVFLELEARRWPGEVPGTAPNNFCVWQRLSRATG